jgi:serine/threonine-protein kinase RIO1
MATYQEIRRQIENLTPSEQCRLLEELTAMVCCPTPAKPKRNILEMEGLGREVWQLDAQEYVNQERASWNG